MSDAMSRKSDAVSRKAKGMKNILVTGACGQLGSEFRYLSGDMQDRHPINKEGVEGFNFMFTTRKELDIENSLQVSDFCRRNEVDVVVNCAAYTAVDKAEQESERAEAINHLAVRSLAKIAKDQGIALIHVSTDYVFDGTTHRPYKEFDAPSPQSVYGKTKLDGELAIQKINPANSIIIRTSWVYSEFGNNFVKTMLRLGQERDELSVVCDQVGTPTNARDLAGAILKIIPQLLEGALKNENVEVYHYSNAGVCSWYDFASSIFELYGIECKVIPISSEAYPTPVKRPYYSVMDKGKIVEEFNLGVQHWRTSLSQLSLN